ncbi:hypothetical protein B0H19DRAFT_1088823 [Mycena capillaripes]|nr:hypothetical protein B0H19DRAFT_1088823 [Mycena capillaripes]
MRRASRLLPDLADRGRAEHGIGVRRLAVARSGCTRRELTVSKGLKRAWVGVNAFACDFPS